MVLKLHHFCMNEKKLYVPKIECGLYTSKIRTIIISHLYSLIIHDRKVVKPSIITIKNRKYV